MQKETIWIAGASGRLGSALVRELKKDPGTYFVPGYFFAR